MLRSLARALVPSLALAALVAAGAAPAAGADGDPPAPFTLVVLPDTQGYTSATANAPTFTRQTQWVVDHRDELGVAFVAQVGDLVGIETLPVQWQRASASMAVLDAAGVPSTAAVGNHDMDLSDGSLEAYQQHFPVSRYAGAAWTPATARYGGYLGDGRLGADPVDRQNADSYALFSAGGMDFLVLTLEYAPSDDAVAWARRVLAAHPDRRAILVTHSYLTVDGALTTQVLRADGGNAGRDLWTTLVQPSCSVFLVVAGHSHGESRRTDTNACGDPVVAVMADFQERPGGGDGWLRTYRFDPAADTVTAATYSPTLDRFETDADSAFTFRYDMGGGSTPPPTPTVLAEDAFARTTSAGWGTAPTGGPWATAGGATRATVSGGVGRHVLGGGVTVSSTLGGWQSASTDVTTTLALDRVPDQPVYLTLLGRSSAAGGYGARVKVLPGGAVQLHATRSDAVLAGGTLPGVVLAPGARLHVRQQVEGVSPTRVRVRAWLDGAPEPTAWQQSVTDATAALQAPGGLRLSSYLSASATGGAVVVAYDDLLAVPVGTQPPPPPANLPPTAAFGSVADGLAVTVDASPSSDGDGSVVSRTWTFGDGASGSGVTATHTYAAGGTYDVTLTVTDDDGASAQTTRQVTVAAPPPTGVLAQDAFARTVAAGWGTAPTGGTWTASATSRLAVADGVGRMTVPPGQVVDAGLPLASSATDLTARVRFVARPAATVHLTTSARVVGSQDYGALVKVYANGSVQLYTTRTGAATAGGVVAGLTVDAGTVLQVRARAVGTSPTTVQAKVWAVGAPEPAAWLTATDGTAVLQQPGGIRLRAYLSSGAPAALALPWDDVLATAP
ncbi:PKD domain-containing protein [Cellulomonas massiliensis]|uniref:PKD domain-containing protein n=1 Tax=Cellulomonas massiliensis TaxID=1465811 RepID=UPI0002EBA80E|nr:PKD domain-containing protein [Cellulomonas massiliensis]